MLQLFYFCRNIGLPKMGVCHMIMNKYLDASMGVRRLISVDDMFCGFCYKFYV